MGEESFAPVEPKSCYSRGVVGAEVRLGESERRVALFVDGDNLPPILARPILEAARGLGAVDVRRVYAAEAGFKAWEGAAGYRLLRVGGAKNGTDLLLSIEAVELACAGGFGAFAIASDDRDFTHLAHWLRERGLPVLGIGTDKSVAGWRAACSEFRVLERRAELVPPNVPAPEPRPPKAHEGVDIDALIRGIIQSEGEGGAIEIGRLGPLMTSSHDVTLAQLGTKTWRAYLETRQNLYALESKGPKAKVKLVGA